MVRPVRFAYNAQTAVNNAFQSPRDADAQQQALAEFNGLVNALRIHGVDVVVMDDTPEPHTPDSIFPNNWISFHEPRTVILYPMFAANRRLERQKKVWEWVNEVLKPKTIIDHTAYEHRQMFLEGTGSMVLDRVNKIAYACISPRTDQKLFLRFCADMGFEARCFDAVDKHGNAIYHTNVLMCAAEEFVVICLEAIADAEQRERVQQTIARTHKTVVDITLQQMNAFAGNMLQVQNKTEEKLLVMSSQAFESLTAAQRQTLKGYQPILHAPLYTIEANGGGSARCMMAEIY